ncbi:MAG: sensor histidine kinase [Sulfuricella sp.]|nr:sensor histidine kinase [Sulfuricella sp.]
MKLVTRDYWRASWISLGLAALFVALLAGAQALETPTSYLHITRAEVLSEETRGFMPPPYALAALEPRGEWTARELPHAPRLHHPTGGLPQPDAALTQIIWYKVTTGDLAPIPAPHYLYIPRWKSDGTIAVYGDGRLLYQSHANLQWNGSNRPLWIALDETAGARPPREIVIRIQHLAGIGGALSSLWVGDGDALRWRYLTRDWLQAQLPFMSSAAFLALGVFSLAVWLKRRGEKLYLLFFVISAAAWIRTLHYHIGLDRLPVSDEWFGWLTVNSLFWLITGTHLFLEQIHQHRQAWLNRAAFAVTIACSILTLPLPGLPDATLVAPLIYVALLALADMAFAADLWHSWQSRSHNGMLSAGWCLFSTQFGVHDWLLQNNLVSIEGLFLGAYANVGAFFLFTYVMFRRYIDAHAEVERVNASLEERLHQREAELTTIHRHLREVGQRELLNRERQRLLQDMHDGLGSSLVSALRVVEHGQLNENEVAQVLRGCIDDLKLTIDSMEPLDADLLLLLATLRFRLAPRLEASGIALRWQVRDVPPLAWLDQRNALHILRILQEAFTNIIKHTQAHEIRVATEEKSDGVVVTVSDDGQGFDIEQAMRKGGKGLTNQLRRAEAIGAKVSWESSGAGTCFSLWLPAKGGRVPDAKQTVQPKNLS